MLQFWFIRLKRAHIEKKRTCRSPFELYQNARREQRHVHRDSVPRSGDSGLRVREHGLRGRRDLLLDSSEAGELPMQALRIAGCDYAWQRGPALAMPRDRAQTDLDHAADSSTGMPSVWAGVSAGNSIC